MNSDIRLETGFRENLKVDRLEEALGPAGPLALIRLWLYVALHRPSGELKNWTEKDVAKAARWRGQPVRLVSTLCQLGFLEPLKSTSPACGEHLASTSPGYQVHEWSQHQAYAAHADERSTQAKRAAEMRWNKKLCNAGSINQHNAQHDAQKCASINQHDAPSPNPDPNPSPSPSPSPKHKKNTVCSPEFEEVWDAYPHDRRGTKSEAWTEWQELKPDEGLVDTMLKAIEQQRKWRAIAEKDGAFYRQWKNLCRWLKKACWTDENEYHQPSSSHHDESWLPNADDVIKSLNMWPGPESPAGSET